MGVTQSTVEEASSLPRIEDPDQFQGRFRELLREKCLSRREQDWLQTVFQKWGSTHESDVGQGTTSASPMSQQLMESQTTFWSAQELIDFMAITIPEALEPDLAVVGPLLHRLMLRLGSFPWHHRASEPGAGLTIEQAETAIILLLRRYESNIVSFHFPAIPGATREEDDVTKSADWMHELIFQCVAIFGTESPSDQDLQHGRNDADDAHLAQAHSLVSAYNKERVGPRNKEIRKGPPIISISELYSSNSQDYGGYIPRNQLKSLLRIILATNLYLYGNAVEVICTDMDKLNQITNNLLDSFMTLENQENIKWDAFKPVLAATAPYLFSALPRLLSPFILDKGLDRQLIMSSTQSEAVTFIRNAFSETSRPLSPGYGSILDPYVLAQLATFLPLPLPLQTASLQLSVPKNGLKVESIGRVISSKTQPVLLLVRGTALDQENEGNVGKDVVLGAFIPRGEGQQTSIFQLSPAQVVVSAPLQSLQLEESVDGVFSLQIRESDKNVASLVLSDRDQSAQFQISRARATLTSHSIQVQSSELFTFAADKDRDDLPLDFTFSIPLRPTQ